MPRVALTGSRIRARRLLIGMRQADLARAAGISASYVNLIEHNRRRVRPGLLPALADALGLDVAALSEGAEAALIEGLREAAAAAGADVGKDGGAPAARGLPLPELDRIEDFIGRFPGWAAQLAAQGRRRRDLEATVERLSDRMAHDPYLSDALHEVLSAVTAIRSTAAILAETEDIAPEWRARFHGNLHQDAVRMSDGAEALVAYLDTPGHDDSTLTAPLEELEAWRAGRDYHLPELEGPGADPAALVAAAPELASGAARRLARDWAGQYRRDAEALPLARFRAAAAEEAGAPAALAVRFGVDLATVFRRLACMPGADDTGLVVCDAAGGLIFRKAVEGFDPPRFGAACPLWPLFEALARPMQPLRRQVQVAGRDPRRFETLAICQPRQPADFGGPTLWEASMLIRPPPAGDEGGAGRPVGTGCRICPRAGCPARREPSILPEEF